MKPSAIACVLVLLMAAQRAAAEQASTVRRFALVIGSNDGGKDRVRLRYANSDAASLARVMSELGGVADADLSLLRDATEPGIREAIATIKRRIAREHSADERYEFLLYFSGHSDEAGLLLGNVRLPYAELRALVADMPVDVKIAILDSCASGALVRLKGGERRQAFLVDASAHARGHAFITSSSADEAAQESDRIAGSFFTHFLVSGLRGAADTTGDKRVTLNEAYQFAFNETLQRTEATQSGPQHPSYDIQLAGSGDLVMTDVRSMHAGILFDEAIEGRLFVRDSGGRLIVELDKPRDRSVEIGLGAGRYSVSRELAGVLSVAKTELTAGQRVVLDAHAFVGMEKERTVRRGEAPEPSITGRQKPEIVLASFAGSWRSGPREKPDAHLMLQLFHGSVKNLYGVAFGIGVNQVNERTEGVMMSVAANDSRGLLGGVQLALGANIARADVDGVQIAVLGNVTLKWHRGLQWSSVFNYAFALSGVQIAPVNVVRGMRGFQIGLVNYASNVEKGFQLGLINLATSSEGEQLGLFSYAGNIPMRLQLYTSDVNAFNVALRFGSRHLYGMVLGGLQPFFGSARGSIGFGLGVHAPFWHLFFDFDVNMQQLIVQPLLFRGPNLLFQARGILGGKIVEHFSIFVGATLNLSVVPDPVLALEEPLRNVTFIQRTTNLGNPSLQLWPGFIVGIQI